MSYRRIRLGQIGKSETVNFAVQELVSYLKKMDTKLVVEVLQTESLEEEFQNIIWVGLDEKLADKVPKVEDAFVDDAITVSVEDSNGYITGSNERSVLLAVYRFLKVLGCNWVRPGMEGERIPVKPIENIHVNICETPSYRYRGVCIEGANTYENIKDMIDYIPKVGMNSYYVQFFVPEIFFERWYLHEENSYLEREEVQTSEVEAMTKKLEAEVYQRGLCYRKYGHGWTCRALGIEFDGWNPADNTGLTQEVKECMAMIDGARGKFHLGIPMFTQMCYSNPIVRKKMVDAAVEACREIRNLGFLCFSLGDGFHNHCECEECQKKSPSDWYVMILNELDERLTAENIDTKISFVLYQDTLWAPKEESIKNPKRFVMDLAPYNRMFGENYSELELSEQVLPPYVLNKSELPYKLEDLIAYLRCWQNEFNCDSEVFDYHLMWAHLNDFGYESCAYNLYKDIQGLRKLGLNGMVNCQVQRCFFPTALPFYIMATTLWDETCDYENKVTEYYCSAFGKDGEHVHNYLKAISDYMLLYHNLGYMKKSRVLPPFCKDYVGLRKEIAGFLPIIHHNIDGADAPYQEEWELLLLHSEYLTRLIDILELREMGDEESFREKYESLIEFLNQNEIKLQKVFDCWNAIDHWNRFA